MCESVIPVSDRSTALLQHPRMFLMLAILLLFYVVHALSTGAVYAKAGVWGRTWLRADDPREFWSAIAVYSLLVVALAFVF